MDFEAEFLAILDHQKQKELLQLFDVKQDFLYSRRIDRSGLQDSFRYRAKIWAIKLTEFLIDLQGNLKLHSLQRALFLFHKKPFLLAPDNEGDSMTVLHIQNVLQSLSDDIGLRKLLMRFSLPLCHMAAEKLVRDTLGLPAKEHLKNVHVRRAVLAAYLVPLRQNVGSCFATAPAILIQETQGLQFLTDMLDLLNSGFLKRMIDRQERAVPLSPGIGVGDLKRHVDLFNPQIYSSQGLAAAMQAAGLLDLQLEDMKKPGLLKELLSPFAEENLTVIDLIHKTLLREMGLTDEKLEKEERRKKTQAFVQHGPMSGAAFFGNGRKEESFYEKEIAARVAFQSITDCPLLKAWEFTLASFCDVKIGFSRWNLFVSLGFDANEPIGINRFLYDNINAKLQECNRQVQHYQEIAERAQMQARAASSLFSREESSGRAGALKGEYQMYVGEMDSAVDMRDTYHRKAGQYARFYAFILEQFDQTLQQNFQEIYDAQMLSFEESLYDDSPAGFRLVYKHGRSDPNQWTFIQNESQFVDCLRNFFIAVESQIDFSQDFSDVARDFGQITTEIIQFVQTRDFLEAAKARSAAAHRGQNRSSAQAKPWAYVSGGTMDGLLKSYYSASGDFDVASTNIADSRDLFKFLANTLRSANLDPKLDRLVLMNSPTHAFILHPFESRFQEGWNAADPLSWLDAELTGKTREFLFGMQLNAWEIERLIKAFSLFLPTYIRQPFCEAAQFPGGTIAEFRQNLAMASSEIFKMHAGAAGALVDAILYKELPFSMPDKIVDILDLLPIDEIKPKCHELLSRQNYPPELLSASDLQKQVCALLVKAHEEVFFKDNMHELISRAARKLKLAYPEPVIFADTNWTNNNFAFVCNPVSFETQVWRMNLSNSFGSPMIEWQNWLNGSQESIWKIYKTPAEYRR